VAAAFAAWMSVSIASADDNTIPRYFDFKFGGAPIWIAATEAITEEGTLRADIQRPEGLKNRIAQSRERPRPSATCDVQYGHFFDEAPDDFPLTLEVLNEVLATRSVISGTVTASAVGIHNVVPYTILQIDLDSSKRVYLMYPRGRLHFDGITFCHEDDFFSEPPSIGDPIVFIASDPIDGTGVLFVTSWIVHEHDGELLITQHLQLEWKARPKSVGEFAKALRAAQRREHRP
jgi:hypothetical protein